MASNRFLNAGGVYSTRNFIDPNISLDRNITLLTQEVNKLKIEVESNQESITNHQTKINEMDPKLNLVDETVDDHTVRIATLEAKVQSNQNRLTDVEVNTDKIPTLESDVDNLEQRMTSLEGSEVGAFSQRLTTVESTASSNSRSITVLNGKMGKINDKINEINPHSNMCNCNDYIDKLEEAASLNTAILNDILIQLLTAVTDFENTSVNDKAFFTGVKTYFNDLRSEIVVYSVINSNCSAMTNSIINHSIPFLKTCQNYFYVIFIQFAKVRVNETVSIKSALETSGQYSVYEENLTVLQNAYNSINSIKTPIPNDHDQKINLLLKITKELGSYLIQCCEAMTNMLNAIEVSMDDLTIVPRINQNIEEMVDYWKSTNNNIKNYTEECIKCYKSDGAPTLFDLLKQISNVKMNSMTTLSYQWKYSNASGVDKIYAFNTEHEYVEIGDYLENFVKNVVSTMADWFNSSCSTFMPGKISK